MMTADEVRRWMYNHINMHNHVKFEDYAYLAEDCVRENDLWEINKWGNYFIPEYIYDIAEKILSNY